jgi:cytidylate kinase
MKAIRGATTVANDNEKYICAATDELLHTMQRENDIQKQDIVFILFSNTADLTSFYPAKAAREAGFSDCALFSALEPNIDGSLQKCIRIMMLVETDKKPKHVYLHGAANLRKDITQKLNIAIDGPAGSGKSTVAKRLASEFDILYLDTGALYRACALDCANKKIDFSDEKSVEEAMKSIDVKVEYRNGSQVTMLDGKDVSADIRRPEISQGASIVSGYRSVREKMVSMQQQIANSMSCVVDGRDIGTVVLPQTPFKFFMTATPEERAMRRFKENEQKGFAQNYETILQEIKERDYRDEHRAISPLKQAADAEFIDTSELSIEEVVDLMKKKIQEKI